MAEDAEFSYKYTFTLNLHNGSDSKSVKSVFNDLVGECSTEPGQGFACTVLPGEPLLVLKVLLDAIQAKLRTLDVDWWSLKVHWGHLYNHQLRASKIAKGTIELFNGD